MWSLGSSARHPMRVATDPSSGPGYPYALGQGSDRVAPHHDAPGDLRPADRLADDLQSLQSRDGHRPGAHHRDRPGRQGVRLPHPGIALGREGCGYVPGLHGIVDAREPGVEDPTDRRSQPLLLGYVPFTAT